MTPTIATEFNEAASALHESVLRLQEVLDRAVDHGARMRSLSDGLQDHVSTLDQPGVMKLPSVLSRKKEPIHGI